MFIKLMVRTSQGRWCFTIISLFLPKGRVVHAAVLHNWYLLTGFYLGLEMETWPRSHKGPLLTKVLALLFAPLPPPEHPVISVSDTAVGYRRLNAPWPITQVVMSGERNKSTRWSRPPKYSHWRREKFGYFIILFPALKFKPGWICSKVIL